jgi:mercuric ion binding protein
MKIQALTLFLLLSLVSGALRAAPRTITLEVRNMTCPVCPITVRKALERVPGVRTVAVDFERRSAAVEFDDEAVTEERLMAATKAAGYPSSIRENRQ